MLGRIKAAARRLRPALTRPVPPYDGSRIPVHVTSSRTRQPPGIPVIGTLERHRSRLSRGTGLGNAALWLKNGAAVLQ